MYMYMWIKEPYPFCGDYLRYVTITADSALLCSRIPAVILCVVDVYCLINVRVTARKRVTRLAYWYNNRDRNSFKIWNMFYVSIMLLAM